MSGPHQGVVYLCFTLVSFLLFQLAFLGHLGPANMIPFHSCISFQASRSFLRTLKVLLHVKKLFPHNESRPLKPRVQFSNPACIFANTRDSIGRINISGSVSGDQKDPHNLPPYFLSK